MRKCIAKRKNKDGEYERVPAIFHQFGSDYEEFEAGPGNYPIAIVEYEDGKIDNIPAECIQFTERAMSDFEARSFPFDLRAAKAILETQKTNSTTINNELLEVCKQVISSADLYYDQGEVEDDDNPRVVNPDLFNKISQLIDKAEGK